MDPGWMKYVEAAERNELTEYHIYSRLAESEKDAHNREILKRIAQEELRHYGLFKEITGREFSVRRRVYLFYRLCAACFGLNFTLRLMEKGEQTAQKNYALMIQAVPQVEAIMRDEQQHEAQLLELVNEERLEYAGSVVLGLNDALVELTGALAGFTLALQKSRLIAVVGLITGIAASLSMAASAYLSTKEDKHKDPLKAGVYTGIAYTLTVIVLVLPYFLLANPVISLACTAATAVLIIAVFNYYISVAKNTPFRSKFLEMVVISLGVALLNFFIGLLVKKTFKLDV